MRDLSILNVAVRRLIRREATGHWLGMPERYLKVCKRTVSEDPSYQFGLCDDFRLSPSGDSLTARLMVSFTRNVEKELHLIEIVNLPAGVMQIEDPDVAAVVLGNALLAGFRRLAAYAVIAIETGLVKEIEQSNEQPA